MWKNIIGYDGKYQINKSGKIKSVLRNNLVMKINTDRYGYKFILLCKNNQYKMCLIHRLLAQTFIPNPNNKREINHINEKKSDNRLCNLEWATSKENYNKFLHNNPFFRYKLSVSNVRYIRRMAGKKSNIELSKIFNIKPTLVSMIRHKKSYKNY